MTAALVKPTDRAIKAYYEQLAAAEGQDALHEGNVRQAFQNLLSETAKAKNLTLVAEQAERVGGERRIEYDGVLRDEYKLPHGWWEAKDTHDNLTAEIRKKIEKGYSLKNIIFEDTREGVLFQDGREVMRADLRQPDGLAELLNRFYSYDMPPFRDFDEAVAHFQGEIPHIAGDLNARIKSAHKDSARFQAAYANFFSLCQTALNPNISRDAVDEMLIQHMLTERLIVRIFDMERFTRQNVIAAEIAKVIDTLTSKYFDYREFLGALDRFYGAIESAADQLATFAEKQHFLDSVYERFFQGYSIRIADTHGIVYTPQPIVDFMCAAVEEVLHDEFGLELGDPGVNILDPCTGTGNFIVHLLHRIPWRSLATAYRERLFANEVMLMPYYIASLNIEHAYYALAGRYEPFEGLAFADTLDLQQERQLSMFTEANTARVERQKKAPITIIIGNPPYNVGQLNENDNNKNRAYGGKNGVDSRVRETYAKDSRATNRNALADPYVKFFRWATDRLQGRDGIVCFVSNNNFVDQIAFDGMRKHLLQDFTRIYHLDLHGNVRKNPKLSGTSHNIFGIQVGVGITVAVRSSKHEERKLFYHRVPESWRKEEKLAYLSENVELAGRHNALNMIQWEKLTLDDRNNWLLVEHADEYAMFVPIGSREAKATKTIDAHTLFKTFSIGVMSSRDNVVFDFDRTVLIDRIQQFIENYNAEVDRYKRTGRPKDVDSFVHYDTIKWSRDLKKDLQRGNYAEYKEAKVRLSQYRPFSKRYHFFDSILNQDIVILPSFFPTPATERDNLMICLSGPGHDVFQCQISDRIVEYKFSNSANGGTQCFPFYIYNPDGTNRRENITDWALAQFREHYGDDSISKWDIFFYVYGLLHHPTYRQKYADNLKRELPRIPFAPDFWAFSRAGKELADLHLNYENVEPYKLHWRTGDKPIDYRVEKMKLKNPTPGPSPYTERGESVSAGVGFKAYDTLVVNDTLTMEGIPPETFGYRLGNRSALEWIVDQYRVTRDSRSGITSDPNRADEPEYIVRLVERVVKVSVETVKIVGALPEMAAN